MPESFRTTSLSVDSDVVARLLEVAEATDIYESRAEAKRDNWERLLTLLMDRFEAEPEALQADVSTKYGGDA